MNVKFYKNDGMQFCEIWHFVKFFVVLSQITNYIYSPLIIEILLPNSLVDSVFS